MTRKFETHSLKLALFACLLFAAHVHSHAAGGGAQMLGKPVDASEAAASQAASGPAKTHRSKHRNKTAGNRQGNNSNRELPGGNTGTGTVPPKP